MSVDQMQRGTKPLKKKWSSCNVGVGQR